MSNTAVSLVDEVRDETTDICSGDDRQNPRAKVKATRAAEARSQSGRRRLVDPTTTDRHYSEAEWEFIQAIQEYKCLSGRMFPTWSEVLEVLKDLGYQKPPVQMP